MKSFILYTDIRDALEVLTDEQAGQLFKAIVRYTDDGTDCTADDAAVKAVFTMIKKNIDRNAEKWEEIRQKRSEAGKMGGRPKKTPPAEEKPQETPEKERKQIYGEYKHVRLTPTEYTKLCDEYGDIEAGQAINYLDEYIERKGYKAKSHYLSIRKWVFDAIKEDQQKKKKISNFDKKGSIDDIFKEAGFM